MRHESWTRTDDDVGSGIGISDKSASGERRDSSGHPFGMLSPYTQAGSGKTKNLFSSRRTEEV